MKEAQKKFLHDSVAEILNLPKNKVIWAYQNNMPRQKMPYVLLRLWGMDAEAQGEIRPPEPDSTVRNIVVPQTVILEVQYFAGTKCETDPSHELQRLIRSLETPIWADAFFNERVVVYNAEPVQDLTELIDGQTYEYRAAVDLRVRYNSEEENDLGQIQTVEISGIDITDDIIRESGSDDENPSDTVDSINGGGALIYGNIDQNGNISDWTRSLPINFNVEGE